MSKNSIFHRSQPYLLDPEMLAEDQSKRRGRIMGTVAVVGFCIAGWVGLQSVKSGGDYRGDVIAELRSRHPAAAAACINFSGNDIGSVLAERADAQYPDMVGSVQQTGSYINYLDGGENVAICDDRRVYPIEHVDQDQIVGTVER